MAQHNAAHTNYAWRAFSFRVPGVVHLCRCRSLSSKHFQGQIRNVPMGLRGNISLLKSRSCSFYYIYYTFITLEFRVKHSFQASPVSQCILHSTLRPKYVNMRWYNWQKSIAKLLLPHVRPIIILNRKWTACLAARFIHGFSAGSKEEEGKKNPQIPQII